MGQQQDNIISLLEKSGFKSIDLNPDFTKLLAAYSKEINNVYKSLGGILPDAPIKFGKFDFVCSDFILEFDEEQHFNRYRKLTLNAAIYPIEHFNLHDYFDYCLSKESLCLKKASFGKYWTSPSTEKQFGKSNEKGDLTVNGSARWKQRAYYDFLKDAWAKSENIKLIRLSMFDENIAQSISKL